MQFQKLPKLLKQKIPLMYQEPSNPACRIAVTYGIWKLSILTHISKQNPQSVSKLNIEQMAMDY